MPRHDLAIVGAGPVGMTLALALKDSGLDILLVDARPAAPPATTPGCWPCPTAAG
jgi:2-octaprenyl-6-methoxyphenol hydroxylase